jgi:hypothetical protein
MNRKRCTGLLFAVAALASGLAFTVLSPTAAHAFCTAADQEAGLCPPGAGGGGGAPATPPPPHVTETMTDRCSADTYVSQDYNDQFPPARGVLLMRGPDGWTPWSEAVPVAGHTYIRWWCHSTSGNFLDPGTYRLIGGGVVCNDDGCRPDPYFGTSAVSGWTPERSRCDSNGTRYIKARLGPDRLLQMQCWGS